MTPKLKKDFNNNKDLHTTKSRLTNYMDKKGETTLGESCGLDTDSELHSEIEDPIGGLSVNTELANFKAYPRQGEQRPDIMKVQ